jgi:uncharacterized membrane protein YkvA (DUF1232 family)
VKSQSSRSSTASSRKRRATGGAAGLGSAASSRAQTRAREEGDAEGPSVPSSRAGAKRTLMSTVKELPNFLRLLGGLLTDRRVSNTDKLLVAGAIAYIVMPMDFIPDYIPFLGEIDDLFVLVLALQRLIANAGRTVIQDHWMGDPGQLRELDLEQILVAAAFFLPRRIRRRLRTLGRDF